MSENGNGRQTTVALLTVLFGGLAVWIGAAIRLSAEGDDRLWAEFHDLREQVRHVRDDPFTGTEFYRWEDTTFTKLSETVHHLQGEFYAPESAAIAAKNEEMRRRLDTLETVIIDLRTQLLKSNLYLGEDRD